MFSVDNNCFYCIFYLFLNKNENFQYLKQKLSTLFRKPARILSHILFWLAIIVFYTFVYGRMSGNYVVTFIHLVYTLPIYIASTYFTLYFIIPRYLLKKKYLDTFIAGYYVVLAAAYFEIILSLFLIVRPAPFLQEAVINGGEFNSTSLDVFLRLIGIFVVVFFASTVKILKHWYNTQKTNQLLTKEKFEAELNFLKSQVHPHFLFNTLNNLYALTLKQSEKAPEVVMKLSELLDYMLYECNTDYIALKKEVNLIKNYISLELLRYDKRADIQFNISGEPEKYQIAPLLLFPFVENSFKHGVSSSSSSAFIYINLKAERNSILFEIENSVPEKPVKKSERRGHGIGLDNIKKRLELIYPENHQLKTGNKNGSYKTTLLIELGDIK